MNLPYRKSRQRDRILELLRSTESHPTADWIYQSLKSEFPSLSLGTVYRNLSILAEQGKVRKLDFGSTFDRFDGETRQHYHLVCDGCGRVEDLDMEAIPGLDEEAAKRSDFRIHRHRIQFHGICSECREKEPREREPGPAFSEPVRHESE